MNLADSGRATLAAPSELSGPLPTAAGSISPRSWMAKWLRFLSRAGEIAGVSLAVRNIHFLEDGSPDGTRLIVATGEKGVVIDRPQWNVSVLGSSVHRLPDGDGAVFTPDGKSVTYTTAAGGI
jgi:hypothetical protein